MSLYFLFFACSEPEISEDMRTVLTDRGSYSVSYRPNPDPIPLSQEFALDITIKDIDGNQIFDNISIEATADMPAHGHGMPQEPYVTPNETTFLAEGFFFQMSGDWELLIYVSEELDDGTINVEQATFEVLCCQ